MIHGEIRSIVHVGNRVRVRIGPVIAEVTDTAIDQLGLAVGTPVVASFKATGTRLVARAEVAGSSAPSGTSSGSP